MKYVSSLSVTPVDFGGLGVRDLIPHFLASASVAHIEVAPGASHAAAKSTRSDKLYICFRGKPTFEVNGEQIQLSPLDLLVVQRNEWFSYRNASDDRVDLFLVHVPPFDLNSEVFADQGIESGRTDARVY